jgi:hypothetical protein
MELDRIKISLQEALSAFGAFNEKMRNEASENTESCNVITDEGQEWDFRHSHSRFSSSAAELEMASKEGECASASCHCHSFQAVCAGSIGRGWLAAGLRNLKPFCAQLRKAFLRSGPTITNCIRMVCRNPSLAFFARSRYSS